MTLKQDKAVGITHCTYTGQIGTAPMFTLAEKFSRSFCSVVDLMNNRLLGMLHFLVKRFDSKFGRLNVSPTTYRIEFYVQVSNA